ncbi:MAG: Lpp/OprI family alanine-zipper lipoprotein [Gammaproteobacteria bacterium]
MKKVVKLSAIVLSAGLAVGCASSGDIDRLQSQIDELKNQTSKIASDASSARAAADEANARAAAAEAAANRAASYAEDTNRKLDNMFKKSMMK